jgi:acetyl esterase/lipase
MLPRLSPAGDRVAWLMSDGDPGRGTAGAWYAQADGTRGRHVLGRLAVTDLAWGSSGERLVVAGWEAGRSQGSVWTVVPGQAPRLLVRVAGVVEQIAESPDGALGLLVAEPQADRGVVGGSIRYSGGVRDPQVFDAGTGARRILAGRGGKLEEIGLPPGERSAWEIVLLAGGGIAALTSRETSESGWYHATVQVRAAGTGDWQPAYRPEWQVAGLVADRRGERLAFLEGWASDRGHLAGEARILDLRAGTVDTLRPPGFDVTSVAWRTADSLWLAGWQGTTSCLGWMSTTGDAGPTEELADPVLQWTLGPPGDADASGPPGPAVAVVRQAPGEPTGLLVQSTARIWSPVAQALGEPVDVDVRDLSWTAADGTRIDGLLVQDPNAPPRRTLVVHVHGGPANLWHRGVSFGTLALAAAGHLVLLPNPRGSVGRGQDFARANLGDPAGQELADLIAGVDHCVDLDLADPDRVAFVGGSYGGYLTACAATMTSRAAAAAVISGHPDLLGARHGSNNGAFYDTLLAGRPDGMEAARRYLQRSPIVHVTPETAPTLLLHGSEDRCTPIGQAEEFHRALLDGGVCSELVVYPREGHGVTEPDHQVDLWARVCRWFDTHLPSVSSARPR